MGLRFTKMQGIGNDYIYINGFEESVEDPVGLARFVSDQRFGIGSDGLILILPSDVADFRMRMFNADGSEGKMCGNGTRCIGKYVYDKGLTDKTCVTLETLSGIKTLELHVEDGAVASVTVDMGKAILSAPEIPVAADTPTVIGRTLAVAGGEHTVTCVSMGNPHCVVFTEGIADLDLAAIGPRFENDPIFPERVNTEFVTANDDGSFAMRVWERGSGETWACGTGACAVCVAAVENGLAARGEDVIIHLRGGDLTIRYETDGTVRMTGPAAFVCDGELL